jgi:hypothetical protein
MTHLSDFSFLRKCHHSVPDDGRQQKRSSFPTLYIKSERAVELAFLEVWFVLRMWQIDRFACLHPSRIRQGELKSILSVLILFMVPFQMAYGMFVCA